MAKTAPRASFRQMAFVWTLWTALLMLEAAALFAGFIAYHLWVPLQRMRRHKQANVIVPTAEKLSQPPVI